MFAAIPWWVRWQQASLLILIAGVILWAGMTMLRSLGDDAPRRYLHGKYVLGWMLAGWILGSVIGVAILDDDFQPGEADIGCAGTGLLFGWLVGMVHGFIILSVPPQKDNEPS